MGKLIAGAVMAALWAGPIAAQEAQPARAAALRPVVPANTGLTVSLNHELRSSIAQRGQTFSASVVQDVIVGDAVAIPRGTRAVGEVTWKTGKGAFGKSGKMDIEMRYLELNGSRIPIEGKLRQEGEGATAATLIGVVLVGVAAAAITGKDAVIPQGRELAVHTSQDIPLTMTAARSLPAGSVLRGAAVEAAPVARRSGESCDAYAGRVAHSAAARNIIRSKCQGS